MFFGWKRFVLILLGISFLISVVCALCVSFDFTSTSFHGFGLDSQGKLYVGLGRSIAVYENGVKIDEIRRIETSRGYTFTVWPDDTLMLASGNRVCILDLQGNERLRPWTEDPWTANRVADGKWRFQEEYVAKRPFGRVVIYHGDQIIYKMPLLDYLVMMLLILSAPCVFVSMLLIRQELYELFGCERSIL